MNWSDLPQRTQHLLTVLVRQFVAHGMPVASKTLLEESGLELSSATVRNITAELESFGLLTSRHSSGGKIPTSQAYRLIAQSICQNAAPSAYSRHPWYDLSELLKTIQQTPNMQHWLSALSSMSQCAALFSMSHPVAVIQKIELLGVSEYKVLLILTAPDNSVQHHLLHTHKNYAPNELYECAAFMNEYYAGLSMQQIQAYLHEDVHQLKAHIAELTEKVLSCQLAQPPSATLMVSGESRLLGGDLSENIRTLKQLFEMFEQKTELLQLLNSQTQGIQIFIGHEQEGLPVDNIAMIKASFMPEQSADAAAPQVVGSIALIGPIRMDYYKLIPMMQHSADILKAHIANTA